MKSEDLFRAMNGIPDELLIRSEEDTKKTVAFERRKRVSVMFLSTAAMGIAAGLLLMTVVRPMLSGRGAADSATVTSAQEQQQKEPALMANAEEEIRAEGSYAAPQGEAAAEAFDTAAEEEAAPAQSSADLLGEHRGDYVKIEYITAEDKENGGAPVEAEYSEEGEQALARAFSEGEPQLSLFGVDGKPLFYIYLTKSDGKTDEVIVYEGGYVTISSKSGVRLKLPEDVMMELKSYLNQ